MVHGFRRLTVGLVAFAALGAVQARAQYYPQQGYPPGPGYQPPPPPGYGYQGPPPPGYQPGGPDERRVRFLQRERNRRVLAFQEQLERGEISRRQFDFEVAQIDREMNERIYGR